jgi:hypothetical protein
MIKFLELHQNRSSIKPLSTSAQPPAPPQPQTGSLWLQRLKIVIEVVFFIELGMLLIILPWTPLWSNNSLFTTFPGLRFFLGNGFVRGLVTGLGFVNLWIGIADAVNYRENR